MRAGHADEIDEEDDDDFELRAEPDIARISRALAHIPADERETVFARFRRGRTASSAGSGLGLALVAQQARLHGADVTVADSPLGGALLRVAFPAQAP